MLLRYLMAFACIVPSACSLALDGTQRASIDPDANGIVEQDADTADVARALVDAEPPLVEAASPDSHVDPPDAAETPDGALDDDDAPDAALTCADGLAPEHEPNAYHPNNTPHGACGTISSLDIDKFEFRPEKPYTFSFSAVDTSVRYQLATSGQGSHELTHGSGNGQYDGEASDASLVVTVAPTLGIPIGRTGYSFSITTR